MAGKSVGGNQPLALTLAATAVLFFALFEYQLDALVELVPIDMLIAYRLMATSIVLLVLLQLLGALGMSERIAVRLDPRDIDGVLWKRGAATVVYLAALAIAFKNTQSQAFTYALFFLHPLWQILIGRVLWKRWPPVKRQLAPVLLILIGALTFAAGTATSVTSDGGVLASLQLHAPALVAGLGFAYTNELGSYICRSCSTASFRFVGGMSVERISGLRVSAYTAYAGLWLLPLAIPAMALVLNGFSLDHAAQRGFDISPLHANLFALTGACVIVAIGTWLFASAFARAKHSAPVAAIDALIVPVAAILDAYAGKLPIDAAQFGLLAASLALIVLGAFWSAFRA